MTAPTPLPQQSRAELTPLSEIDIPEVAAFIASQSGRDKAAVESHLRWFLLENPARRSEDPLGFGLRSADRLVGCILISPQVFRCGTNKILFLGSSSFYVDQQHRGHGGRIFLQYCRLGKQRPLFGTSANPEAAALWKAAGAHPIPYSDYELFGVMHWPPVTEEFAHRRHSSPALTRLAGSSISRLAGLLHPLKIDLRHPDILQPLTSAEQANDLLGNRAIYESFPKLTAERDLPYLRWRYFSGCDSTVAAFAYRSTKADRRILITVNQRTRGYRSQIRTLNLLDVFPEVSADELLRIVGALAARYKSSVDAIVLRSLNPDRQIILLKKGFRRRMFDAPIGWVLDRNKILPTPDWYPVPADGDGLI
jgi:hypothetical protein